MLSLSHTLLSLPIAAYADNLWLIFILAFCLHLVADSLPHWNLQPDEKGRYPIFLTSFDIITGLLLAWLILRGQVFTLPFLVAIFAGNLPDILHGLWNFQAQATKLKWPAFIQAFFIFHHRLQWETKTVLPGLVSQIAGISLVLWLVTLA